jgi:hypothetical protein
MTIRYLREWEICFLEEQKFDPGCTKFGLILAESIYCPPLLSYGAELSAIWQGAAVGGGGGIRWRSNRKELFPNGGGGGVEGGEV